MKHITFTLTIFLITILVYPSAWSKDKILSFFENSKDEVKITANKIEARFTSDGYEVIFIGKVRGEQGPLSMKCDKLVIILGLKVT